MYKDYTFYVYILTNPDKTTLYIGMTNSLKRSSLIITSSQIILPHLHLDTVVIFWYIMKFTNMSIRLLQERNNSRNGHD